MQNSNRDEFECGVCFREYDGTGRLPLMLPCTHLFCKECIIGWRNKKGTFNCPICMQEIKNLNVDTLDVETSLLEAGLEDRFKSKFLAIEMNRTLVKKSKCPICTTGLTLRFLQKSKGVRCEKCNNSLHENSQNFVPGGYFLCPCCDIFLCLDCVTIEMAVNQSMMDAEDLQLEERKNSNHQDHPLSRTQTQQFFPKISPAKIPSPAKPSQPFVQPHPFTQPPLITPPKSDVMIVEPHKHSTDDNWTFDDIKKSIAPLQLKAECPLCNNQYAMFTDIKGKECNFCGSNLQSQGTQAAFACFGCKLIQCLVCKMG